MAGRRVHVLGFGAALAEGKGAGNFGGAKQCCFWESSLLSRKTEYWQQQHTRGSNQNSNYNMSRQSMAPQRNLSLTEELEKLEQSITLTLQGKHGPCAPHQRD